MKMIKTIIQNVMHKILLYATKILPTKDIMIFESNSDFCDSSKTLFDYIIENELNKKFKIIWLVKNPKSLKNKKINNVYFIKKRSKINIKFLINPLNFIELIRKSYYEIVAKYCFYTHEFVGIPNNDKQIRFFLTHSAFPIKDVRGCYWDYSWNTYIDVTSEYAKKYRCESFGGGEDRAKIMGLPRNDELFKPNNYIDELNLKTYKKIIMWLPTFKHQKDSKRNDFNISVDNDITILNSGTMLKVNKLLKEYNSLLIVKFHPAQNMEYVNKTSCSNIMYMTNDDLQNKAINLYGLLGSSDALITDFSSVYLDYLLLDKPIGFELGDKEKFENGRGFMVNPLEYMPGQKIYSEKEFLDFIYNVCNDVDEFKIERKRIRDMIHKYKDGNSSKRILQELKIINTDKEDE